MGDAALYDVTPFGNVGLMHITDTHAQPLPIYFREPNINIGVAEANGRPPHIVGEASLKHFNIPANSAAAYALTYLDIDGAALRQGRRLRAPRDAGKGPRHRTWSMRASTGLGRCYRVSA